MKGRSKSGLEPQVELPAPLWVGADVIKALAAPTLAKLVYQPPSQEELGRDPVLVAEERSTHAVEPSKPPKDEAIRAHEYRAAVFLRKGQPVATLAELEAALCLSEKRSLIPPNEIRERWQTLAASALAWSFDCLAQAAQPGNQWQTQVLQMLCTCEILTRFEVAETFGAESMVLRPFLRALSHLGLGQYYQLRKKPRAAARFLEQAANGQAQWVHPAILLNLSSVHLLLKEPGKALSCLCQVVLALKNSIGPLCPNSDQVEGALEAAQTAVTQVLGPIKEDQRQAALVEVDPFGHGIDLGEEKGRSLRVVPGHLLDTPEVSKSTVVQEAKVPSTPRRGLGRHGLISKEHLQGEEAFGYEVDAAVVRILLRAKALLKPEAQAETEAEAGKKALEETLRKMAAPGVAKHYAKLKQVWPYWKSVTQDLGIGLVFRECLLLCFLHVACALAQLSSKRVYDLWVVPSLREGLVLAIVLFGSKHPLALKLMNASRRLQPEVQHSDPPPKVQRPSMARRCQYGKEQPKRPKTAPKPKKRPDLRNRAKIPPAWNAGPGMQPGTGSLPVAETEPGSSPLPVRPATSRPITPVRQSFWSAPERQRDLRNLHVQAITELRRERQGGVPPPEMASCRSLKERPSSRAGSASEAKPGPRSTLRECLWQKAARHRHLRQRQNSVSGRTNSVTSLSASFSFPSQAAMSEPWVPKW